MKPFYVFTVVLLGALFGSVISALYLQAATRVVAGFKPTYGTAYKTSFLAGFLFAVAIGIGCLADVIRVDQRWEWDALTVFLFFVIHLCVYSGQLIHPDRGYVGVGSATVIVFMQQVIAVTIVSVICWTMQRPAPLDLLRPLVAKVIEKKYSTPQEAQREAVRRYPQLAVQGSRLHREFLARYRRYQNENPGYFQNTSWPIHLAEECAYTIQPPKGSVVAVK